MTSAEWSMMVEVIHELDNARQIIKLDREASRLRGRCSEVLEAYDSFLNRSGTTADRAKEFVDEAWMEQAQERKALTVGTGA